MVVVLSKTARRSLYLSLYLMLISLLCSCIYSPSKEKSVYNNGRVDLLVLYKYSVPFLGDSLESVGDIEIYPVEVDDYGRTLGIMQGDQTRMDPLFGRNAVYCVLQSGDKKESCFYEDNCCISVENGLSLDEAIERLKQNNDWNTPLMLDKCRRLSINNYSASGAFDTDIGYNYNFLSKKACNAVRCSDENTWLDAVCKDGHGLWLFALILDPIKEDSPVYLIMMQEKNPILDNGEPEFSVIGSHLLEKRSTPWEEIRDFKKEMGWIFAEIED
ncbi:MAG: hypothetical protein IIY94_07745 [Oscillospiraceae bacterium]|nr:hypothetical protein [Oscillospiraceae bacterium]